MCDDSVMRYRRHVFICVEERIGGGKPACGSRGGKEVLAKLQTALATDPTGIDIAVTGCHCLGPCFDGPNAIVYPEGAEIGALSSTGFVELLRMLRPGE
jgi:NADH:ubiquinone oxidoreductase subunit E